MRFLFILVLLCWRSAFAADVYTLTAAGSSAVTAATGVNTASGPFRLLVDAPNVSKFILGVDVSGDVIATAGGTLSTSKIPSAPVTVAGSIPKASVAAALGRFAGKSLPVLSTGYALYDLAQELGLVASNKADGSAQFSRENEALYYRVTTFDPSLTQQGACENWRSGATYDAANNYCMSPQIWYPNGASWAANANKATACSTWAASGGYTGTIEYYGGSNTYGCKLNTGYVVLMLTTGSYASPVLTSEIGGGSTTPVTIEEFVDDVATKSGWPSTSNLAKATKLAIESGEVLDVIPRTITGGPAESPESVVSTSTDPVADTTTTIKEKEKLTYNPTDYPYSPSTGTPPATAADPSGSPWPGVDPGYQPSSGAVPPNVTITNKTTTSVTNNTTNVTTIINETETPPEPLTPQEQMDLCAEHPEILACKTLDPPGEEPIPKDTREISLQTGPTFGGGGCIPDVVVSIGGRQITVLAMTVPCGWIENLLKPFILLLAAVSAVFIVMPRAGD